MLESSYTDFQLVGLFPKLLCFMQLPLIPAQGYSKRNQDPKHPQQILYLAGTFAAGWRRILDS